MSNRLTMLAARPLRAEHQLFLLSFLSLFLELLVIRWVPSQFRLIAYYANLMLISSFLGLGLGLLSAAKRRDLSRYFPPLLLVYLGFFLLFHRIELPGNAQEFRFHTTAHGLVNYLALTFVFILNTALFLPIGRRIGGLFEVLSPQKAYAWDLVGSLLGTVAFGCFSFSCFSPTLGFTIVAAIFLLQSAARERVWTGAFFVAAIGLVYFSGHRAVLWSPYHYVTVAEAPKDALLEDPAFAASLRTMVNPPLFRVQVNQDFYQWHGTIREARYQPVPDHVKELRSQYLLPYELHPHPSRVLIVGAGGGVDAEAARIAGATSVDAVEIDPALVKLSRFINASDIYDDPKVHIHINDARAFFKQAQPGYDVVTFGFLDSQALFNSMSNVRLDGFVYTVESIRAAFRLLNESGMLSIAFVVGDKEWLRTKLFQMVKEGTGVEPLMYSAGTGIVLCVSRHWPKTPPAQIGPFTRQTPEPLDVSVPTDDWPYLYLSQRAIPSDYGVVIGTLALLSLFSIWLSKPGRPGPVEGQFFFLGAGFLLLQTKSIVDCSLYFGTTWAVTLIVICGILLMVFFANLVAMRITPRPAVLYVGLFAALLAVYAFRPDTVLSWDLGGRLAWALLAVPLPIFFAGLIFSMRFRTAPSPSAAFGANLLGATLGGFSEYLGMAVGYRHLFLLLAFFYAASLLCSRQASGSEGLRS